MVSHDSLLRRGLRSEPAKATGLGQLAEEKGLVSVPSK